MQSNQDVYNELSYYTLAHPDPSFIHQHIVDAYTAQHADEHTKPITITFAIIGLYLHIEKNLTGKQVQKAHMRIAQKKRQYPTFPLPKERGNITVSDAMKTPAGKERDEMIQMWCVSVWEAYSESHKKIAEIVNELL